MVSKNPDKKFICPSYKIIILDEADSMTTDAQSGKNKIFFYFLMDISFINLLKIF
jgi:hypothetical protein